MMDGRRKDLPTTTYKNTTGKLGIVTYPQFVNFACKLERMSGKGRIILI